VVLLCYWLIFFCLIAGGIWAGILSGIFGGVWGVVLLWLLRVYRCACFWFEFVLVVVGSSLCL